MEDKTVPANTIFPLYAIIAAIALVLIASFFLWRLYNQKPKPQELNINGYTVKKDVIQGMTAPLPQSGILPVLPNLNTRASRGK